MLQPKVLPSFESFSIPGKIFILGEYAVLAGLPALVAAVGPRFKAQTRPAHGAEIEWPSGSPVSRYLKWAQAKGDPEVLFDFLDPFEGAGGFGASTAQFALAYQLGCRENLAGIASWYDVWRLYRELMSSEAVLPSGADLVAQWEGGVVFFDPSRLTCENFGKSFDWSHLLVFSATHQPGRKVPTHEHLRQLSSEGFPQSRQKLVAELERLLRQGVQSVRENDSVGLGQVMTAYALELQQAGWEVKATTEDRLALSDHPCVLGVKGTGALQSDALIVLTQKGLDRGSLLDLAKKRGLRLVCEGLSFETGVRCESRE